MKTPTVTTTYPLSPEEIHKVLKKDRQRTEAMLTGYYTYAITHLSENGGELPISLQPAQLLRRGINIERAHREAVADLTVPPAQRLEEKVDSWLQYTIDRRMAGETYASEQDELSYNALIKANDLLYDGHFEDAVRVLVEGLPAGHLIDIRNGIEWADVHVT